MRNRTARIALVLLFGAGVAAAGYQIVTLDRRQAVADAAHDAFEALAIEIGSRVTSVQAAQQAYVAAGQGVDFWMQQAGTLLEQLQTDVVELKQLSSGQESATAIGIVSQTIDGFVELDQRVREYAASGQVLMASDIIFTDGLQMIQRAIGNLLAAREDESHRAERQRSVTERQQAGILAGTAGAALLVALLLLPTGAARATGTTETDTNPVDFDSLDDAGGLSLGPVRPGPTSGERGAARRSALDDRALADVAALCADLAKVVDAHELPRLLERSAELVGASGLTVWLAAQAGHPLRPILTHGYSGELVRRMGTIARDADNATAAAFRDATVKVVASDAKNHGAIVAPLTTGLGCIGSLALEIPSGIAIDDMRKSIARIIASPLALLLADRPDAAATPSEQAGDRARAQG